jgi:hypothetical protein
MAGFCEIAFGAIVLSIGICWFYDKVSPNYRTPLLMGIAPQVVIVIFLILCEDTGLLQTSLFASVAYWVGVTMIAVRRRRNLQPFDRAFISYSYYILFLLAPFLSRAVWQLRGL